MNKNVKTSLLAMGLILLVLAVVGTNDWATSPNNQLYMISDNNNSLSELNRAIASAQPMSLSEQLGWEKELGNKIKDESEGRKPSSIAKNPELLDQMTYGKLAGKYQLHFAHPGYVSEVAYVDNAEVNEFPVAIEAESFLKDYKNLWVVQFENYELESKIENQKVFKLMNSDHVVVGKAHFQFDENDRLTHLKFESVK